MPIRPELRALYPANWRELSHAVRFERAGGKCQSCGRPHGGVILCLPDGRWFDRCSGPGGMPAADPRAGPTCWRRSRAGPPASCWRPRISTTIRATTAGAICAACVNAAT